jgi:hypothetical protein
MIKRNLVTQEELDTLAQIDRDCIKMHVCPPPKTVVDMEVRDAGGVLVDGFTMKSNSWVRNAYNWNDIALGSYSIGSAYEAGSLKGKRTNGTLITFDPLNQSSWGDDFGGSVDRGVVIGTGTTAESFEHFALSAVVPAGNASGQMAYNAMTYYEPTYDSGDKKWQQKRERVFNNNSGASITVNEVGMIMQHQSYPVLMSRDLLSEGVTVPNGGQLTVTYTIEMTFPG